ncbi:unnamed protein product [Chrysoparadoxa australica]
MIEVIYISFLSLLIPWLLWTTLGHCYKHASGRAKNDSKGFLTRGFLVKVAVLSAACWLVKDMADSVATNTQYFDPYEILELPGTTTNRTLIRESYRRLSLSTHPDKNPGLGRKEANRRFADVAKAYKALADSTGRKNYKLYGHPDGPQSQSYEVPLPEWLKPGKDAGALVYMQFAVGYLAVIIGFVVLAKRAMRQEEPGLQVSRVDVELVVQMLRGKSEVNHVLECIACAPQLNTVQREEIFPAMSDGVARIEALLKEVKAAPLVLPIPAPTSNKSEKGIKAIEGAGGTPGPSHTEPARSPLQKHNLVLLLGSLHGYSGASKGGSTEADAQLQQDQDFIIEFAGKLLDACLAIAAQMGEVGLFSSVVKAKALVRRRLWSDTDPAALKKQRLTLKEQQVALPLVSVKKVQVECWGENQIAVGDLVTTTVTVTRKHAKLYQGIRGLSPLDGSPVKPAGEGWWVAMSTPSGGLVGANPVLVDADKLGQEEIEATIKFKAPQTPCTVKYLVHVISPLFAGCGAKYEGEFKVVAYDEIEEEEEEDDDEDDDEWEDGEE